MQQFSVRTCILFLTACFLSVLAALPVQAQFSAGLDAGFNKNYLITNNANRAFTNYKPLNGFSIGVPVQYKLADWFAVAAEPSLIRKNYRQERSDFFTGVYQNTRNTYIQLPVMAHFMFGGEKLKGFLNTGVYASYWASSHVNGVMPNILDVNDGTGSSKIYDYENPYSFNEKYSFDKRKDNRFEAGWVAGLGLSYSVNERYEVFTEGRLLYGFTDQQKKYMTNQIPRYNTTYGLNAGVLIHFKQANNAY